MKKWFAVLCCLLMALSSAWAQDLTITFDENTKTNPAYTSESFVSDGVTFDALRCLGGNAGASESETDKCIRLQHAGKGENITNACFATADALEGAITQIAFDYKAASATHTNRQWALETSTDGGTWDTVATVTTAEGWLTETVSEGIPAGSKYFRIISANTGTTTRMADFDNIKVWYEVDGITVTFDQTNWFEVVEGTLGASVTATADNGVPPYTYVWNCDQSEAITDVAGDTLAIPATLTEGDYSLFVTVTDSDDGELGPQGGNFGIGLRVVKLYEVTVVNGVDAHGTILVDLAHAKAGDTVTIGTEPDDGYVLESLSATWEGGNLEIVGGKFTMPAGEVTVSGTFAEYTGGDLTITFDTNKTTDPGYAATSFTSATLPEEAADVTFDALRCYGGDAGFSGKAMRVQNVNGTNGFFATANAFEKPISRIKFVYKAYNAASADKDWVLQTSTDGSAWATVATVAPASHEEWATADATDTIPANSVYFRITGLETNTTKTAWSADFDEIDLWFGEASYRVELSGIENGARVPYVDEATTVVTLTAAAKDGGQEPFTYEWTINGGVVDGYTGATYEFAALGDYAVSVTCTDANNVTTDPVGVNFSIKQQYAVQCPVGTVGGAITAEPAAAFEGDTVALTATAEEGYALDGELTATWAEGKVELSKSNTFEMPAGDVTVSGSFRKVQDTAALPFEWHGPWKENLGALDGVTGALGADGSDKNYENQGNGVANFGAKSHNFCVKFDSAPATVSYWIHGTAYETNAYTFQVQESLDGETWSDVAVYTSTDEGIGGYAQVTNELKEASRYVKFSFLERSAGSVGVDGIVIAKGEGGGGEPVEVTATVTGDITFADGKAKLSVSIDNDEVVPTADDIWAASELVDEESEGYWKQAEGATIVPTNDGSYEVTVPETAGNYISIGKPKFLNAE